MIATAKDFNLDISGHDPYLIYHMLHREISFDPPRGRSRSGMVQSVLRNIFDNQVELTIDGKLFSFDEPVAIIHAKDADNGSVIFVYGNLEPDISDEELFGQMRNGGNDFYGETVDDVLARTTRDNLKTVRFLLGEKVRRRKTWRMKQVPKTTT
jgi:hypothetical protein